MAEITETKQETTGKGLFSAIKLRFKGNPAMFYSMSIAATWAGPASFFVGTGTAQQSGLIPVLLWALGNTLACIVFGICAQRVPKLREVFMSKPARIIVGLMCVFQVWLSMQGINQALGGTVIGGTAAMVITYVIALAFLAFYMRDALVRNVLTDNGSWLLVYVLIVVLALASIAMNGVHPIPLGTEPAAVMDGAVKMVKLLPGCFLYPVFWQMFEYNDEEGTGTAKVNMEKSFIVGGLLFGVYLLFILLISFTEFSPATELLKGIMITLVAMSTLSSFIYGLFISFGKGLGVGLSVAAIGSWAFLVPLGVMGIWSLMADVRIVLVLIGFAIAIGWHLREKHAEKQEAERA